MNRREAFQATVNHQEPERVLVDLGRHVGSIHKFAYSRLVEHLGDSEYKNHDKILDRMVQNVFLDEKLLRRFNVDFRWLVPNWVGVNEVDGEDAYTDMWGIKWTYMLDSYSMVYSPLKELTIDDLGAYPWPDPYDPLMFKGLREQAKYWYENTDYVIVADSIKGGLLTKALQIRGYEAFFSDLARDINYAEALLDQLLWLYKEMWTEYLKAVGPYIQMVYFTDDIGAQESMMISPATFRTLLKPRLKELIDHIKGQADVQFMYHTDGSVVPVFGDIIEMGVDILNPIQTSALGMDTYFMKETYGDRLCFHGAIDVQKMLPFSSVEEIHYDVAKRIYDLGRGGGFILSPCHNIGSDVSPENILALFDAVQKYGSYPLDMDSILKPEDLNPVLKEPEALTVAKEAPPSQDVVAVRGDSKSDPFDEILDEIYDNTIEGEAEAVVELTNKALELGMEPHDLLFDGLIPALEEVGRLFEEGTFFVPEMMIAAKAMQGAMKIIKPLIVESGIEPVGKFVMGTVKGDIHDIGKDLCNIMLEGAGFEVYDLGVNVSPDAFVEAIREHQPDAVGMSAFLTTTMPMFAVNIEQIRAAGLREAALIYVGGAPVSQEYSESVGADGYAPNGSALVRDLKQKMGL